MSWSVYIVITYNIRWLICDGRNLFLRVWRLERPRSRCLTFNSGLLAIWHKVRRAKILFFSCVCVFVCVFVYRKGAEIQPFIGNPFMNLECFLPKYLLKVLPCNTDTGKIAISI